MWTTAKMSVIRPYSLIHLIIVIVVLLVDIIVSWLLIRKKVNRRAIFGSLGVILLILECMKQVFLVKVYGSYSWSDFPWQLCSIPMYICLLYPWVSKKLRRIFEAFLVTFGMLGGIAAFAEPTSSFTEYRFLTAHSIFWHASLLFLGIYLVMVCENEYSWREFRNAGFMYLIVAFVAIFLNSALMKVSGGDMNMFFLGPSYPWMIILDSIYEKCGWIIESVCMMAVTLAGGGIMALLTKIRKRT